MIFNEKVVVKTTLTRCNILNKTKKWDLDTDKKYLIIGYKYLFNFIYMYVIY